MPCKRLTQITGKGGRCLRGGKKKAEEAISFLKDKKGGGGPLLRGEGIAKSLLVGK